MSSYSQKKLEDLCQRLQIEAEFLTVCVEESVIEIEEIGDQLDLGSGSILHLRRLERICHTLNVEPPVAILLNQLMKRIAELEKAQPN